MMYTPLIPVDSKTLNQLYTDYAPRFISEQALLSDLSRNMYEDAITYFNLNQIQKAETTIFALCNWLCRDVLFFISRKEKHQLMYEYDVVSSLQQIGQLINMCEDFKQFDMALTLQREYSKLNIKYATMQAA